MLHRSTFATLATTSWLVLTLCVLGSNPAAAATIVVDFDGHAAGTTLTTQVDGVTFPAPTGVQVIARGDAHSPPNVGIEPFDGEFARHRFEAVFDGNQNTVELWVKPESASAPSSTATLTAYAAGGAVVDTASVVLATGSGWRLLAVGSATGSPQIRRIVLREMQGSFETNFFIVDDLEAFSEDPPPPPPPPDETAPVVDILQPAGGATLTTRFGTVRITASDDEELFEVAGTITHQGSGTVVGAVDGCGPSSFYGACTLAIDRSHGFELDADLTGSHRIDVEACDASGNCATDVSTFLFLPAPPPAEVEAWWIEPNQGVQWTPRQAFSFVPGDDETYTSPVPLIFLKDMLVRFYLFGDGGARPGFTESLRVTVHRRDGSTAFLFTAPNAGATTVDVVAKPATSAARFAELERMRVDLSRTLNFVIPASLMTHATRLELELDDVSGTITIPLDTPTRLDVLMTRIITPETGGGTNAATPPSDLVDRIEPYLDQAMPAWVRALSPFPTGTFRIGAGIQAVCELVSSPCGCALWQFSLTPSLAPDNPTFTSPGGNGEIPIAVRLGVVGFDALDGALGCAYIGDPSDANDRRYAPAITEAFGDVAAQEIAHALSLIHASDDHGESGGGSAEGDWPYQHGTIGEQNFGVVLRRASGAPGSFGTWQVSLIDTCPGNVGADRRPCPLPDNQQAHDFMSYGVSNTDLGPLTGDQVGGSWVSDRTYSRVYDAIRFGISASSAAGLRPRASGTALGVVISGVVADDGSVELLPVLRHEQFLDLLAPGAPGPYTLSLFDHAGTLLAQRSFAPAEVTDHEHPHHFFIEELPDEPTLHRVVVAKDGVVLAERTGSAHAPTVRVLAPNGGEVHAQGNFQIRWQASDADGDPLFLLVELSRDGGASWQTLASLGPGDPSSLTLPVGEIEASARALVRVRASDGLLEGTDASDCLFSVNTSEVSECEVEVEDPEPPSAQFHVSPVFPDFGFQVRITNDAGTLPGTFEPSCIGETVCVSGALAGRSEVFLRIVGPKPNGKLWPTLVKFSTATIEIWIKQLSSGVVRYYQLEGARPGFDVLPGLFDRQGFDPPGAAASLEGPAPVPRAVRWAAAASSAQVPPLPPGPYLTSSHFPDFRFKVRILSADAGEQEVRQEAACIEETICVSGALPGRSEVFLRIVGPKPNGYLWPTLVKFTTSQVEVWVEQISSGVVKHYELPGAQLGVDELPGLFDRTGFLP